MHPLKPLLFILPLAATHPLPLSSQQASPILTDLHALDASTLALRTATASYTGGIPDALPIVLAIGNVHLTDTKGLFTALASPSLSAADSQPIADYIRDVLAIDIPDALTVLKGKKDLLIESGLKVPVLASLQLLKSDHETYSAQLESKIAPETLSEAETAVKKIDDAIQAEITDFSSS